MEESITNQLDVLLEKMTPEEILKLPIVFLQGMKKSIARNFTKLPPVLQSQLWDYQYCWSHCYQDKGDQVDGPPVQIMDCVVCMSERSMN